MKKNQKIVFWSMFVGFCFVATYMLYQGGAFDYTNTLGGLSILMCSYLIAAFFMHKYVAGNVEETDKWFK